MVKILRDADMASVAEVAKNHGVSDVTIYAWRKRFGKLVAVDVKRLRQLEHENARLKKVLAERVMDIEILKDVAVENGEHARASPTDRLRLPSAASNLSLHDVLRLSWAVQMPRTGLWRGDRSGRVPARAENASGCADGLPSSSSTRDPGCSSCCTRSRSTHTFPRRVPAPALRSGLSDLQVPLI